MGTSHTCAVTTAGDVLCWGRNNWDQLGVTGYESAGADGGEHTGTPRDQVIVAVYSHTCAVTIGGGLACWGYNFFGQLGDGTTTNRSTPTFVLESANGGVTAVTAHGSHTCALTTAGNVLCWARNNFGQLGDGTTSDCSRPMPVAGLGSGGVAALEAGGAHTCALTTAGDVLRLGTTPTAD